MDIQRSDSDNSETDGYLYVYGEDLDIDSHNKNIEQKFLHQN